MTQLAPGTLASFTQAIQNAVGKPKYDLWFQGNTRLSFEDGVVQIGVPNRFFRDWLEKHFRDSIKGALQRAFGEGIAVKYRIDPALFQQALLPEPAAPPPPRPVEPLRPQRPSRYSLSRFIVGPTNRLAYTAATSFLDRPETSFSPLFLFGDVGQGKTHLLKAIEESVRHKQPALNIVAVPCEEFANEFLDMLHTGRVQSFRRKFRRLDVLLIDDVQFLAGKKATEEEFLHTLNALEAKGGKVVLTCDSHPRKLTKICGELRSRFMAGVTAKIDPPNREMRRRIVSERTAQRQLALKPEIIELIADNMNANICELEGALNYLEHYIDVHGPLDLTSARNALAETLRHSAPSLTIADVCKKMCDVFDLQARSLKEKSRCRNAAHARMLALYLSRRFTRATYSEIGQKVGEVNHSTVIASEKRLLKLLHNDGEIVLGDTTWKARDAVEMFERVVGKN